MTVEFNIKTKTRRDALEAIMALTGREMYQAMAELLYSLMRMSHKGSFPDVFKQYIRAESNRLFLSKRRRAFLRQHLDDETFAEKLRVDEFIDLLMLYIRDSILEDDHNVHLGILDEWENTSDAED